MNKTVLLLWLFIAVVPARPAAADAFFGWGCVTNCENAPASFMIEIHELAAFDVAIGTYWPEFLWEITSLSVAYRNDPEVHSVAGNPFDGWEGVEIAGFLAEYIPIRRLILSRDLSASTLSFRFNDLLIWSDPTYYPLSNANHDIWSIANVDNPSQVSTGVLVQCSTQAQCLDPALRVPEPSSLLLTGLGALGFVVRGSQRRRRD